MAELREYQSRSATREVLGCLIQNPTLLLNYKIETTDFVEAFHKLLFLAISNKYALKATMLDSYIIDSYLKENYPDKYIIFSRNSGSLYVEKAKEMASPENFESNYIELKKYSLLRSLLKEGFDVSYFCNPDEIDIEEQTNIRKHFEENSLDDIVKYYREKLLNITSIYTMKNDRDSVKAGSLEAKAQKELWKEAPDFGLSYASNFMTTVTNGIRHKRFNVLSAGTGTGKTRLSIANICHSFVPKYYDSKLGKFVDNPNGKQNSALYIGTEMELIEEIEPILWAYIADVPQEHIMQGQYEPGEEERVDEAIRILGEEGHIYLEYVPDYDLATLENVIEQHVTQHGIRNVFFDYIHITTDLISEFQNQAKAKMQIREDQVLANLSTKLKELTRKYNISLDTWTQVSGNFKDENNRDQTIVRGAKSIIDKADCAGIVSRVTQKELDKLSSIIRAGENFGKPEPNVCVSIYKNRGGSHNNVKIWLWVDYNTMRVHDLYVTDYDYKLDNKIKQRFTIINEDQKIKVFDSKEEVNKQRHLEESIDIIDDGETNIIDTLSDDFNTSKDNNENQKKIIDEKEKKRDKEVKDLQAFLDADEILNMPQDYTIQNDEDITY